MQIAIVAAGFDPSEADQLRRALATFRKSGTIHTFRERFVAGMTRRGYEAAFAERCFSQIEGFGEYGFPESHAASFALLVYASAWLKKHHPAAFACALLNAQPMGFYAPAQIVRDARAHGVAVRPVSINHSFWDNTLEPDGAGGLALRLGFRQIKGVAEDDAVWISSARGNGYLAVEDVWRRAGAAPALLERLAEADAFHAIGLTRRDALWAAKGVKGASPAPLFADLLEGEGLREPQPHLPSATLGEEVVEDYQSVRLTLRSHPLALLRDDLSPDIARGVRVERLADAEEGRAEQAFPKPSGSAGAAHFRGATSLEATWRRDRARAEAEGRPPPEKPSPLAPAQAATKPVGVRPGCLRAADLAGLDAKARVSVAGLVIVRQRPGSAKGVIFLTLEDETGSVNVVVWQRVYQRFRRAVIAGRLLRVEGEIQREGEGRHAVIHVVADRIEDASALLDRLSDVDFANAEAHADEVRRPVMRDPNARGRRRAVESAVSSASSPLRSAPTRAAHPRDQARRLFPSRDFH